MEVSKQRVAITGSGVSGLCILRRLSERCCYDITAFERKSDLGGIWLYTDKTSCGGSGETVVNPVYDNMRTNVTSQMIEFEGFPFKTSSSFPLHSEVLAYLNDVADKCGIRKYIKFNTEVVSIRPSKYSVKNPKWLITYQNVTKPHYQCTEEFDAVVVSNGCGTTTEYSPQVGDFISGVCRLPLPGEERFAGSVTHSVGYRRPEFYRGKNVAILGTGISGVDIGFDLQQHAKQIFLCHKGIKLETKLPSNITEKLSCFSEFTESSVILRNGDELFIDAVIYCTGYSYDFSFLPKGLVDVGENKIVSNLFKAIVSVKFTNLFFMGTLRDGSFFLTGDRTAKFIRAVLDGTTVLPDETSMREIIAKDEQKFVSRNGWIHLINDLANMCNSVLPVPNALIKIWQNYGDNLRADYGNCKYISYKLTGEDSFDIVYK